MSSAVADQLTAPTGPVRSRPALSSREVEVLRTWLLADTKEEAARALYLSPATVTTYITRLRAKYLAVGRPARCKSRLLAYALQDELIRLEDFR
jgi:DNA-binding CsgD family transcriptional regulator